jgi:PAS domain S-box-containing protein
VTLATTQLIQKDPGEQVVTSWSHIFVLVVDDDRTKRLALNAALSPLGVSVIEAESGIDALRRVSTQDFAVILLDVRMPTMNGFETAALIRQRERSEMTPIIFITASTSDEIVERDRYTQGAVDFIFAPVNPNELRAKVSVFASLFLNADTLATQAREAQISADELRLLTDVAPIGIFRTDNENRYVYVNPRWCEITGIPHDEALGIKLGFGLQSEQHFDVSAGLTDSDPQTEFICRYETKGPDSTTRVAIVTAVAIPNTEGGTAGWAGTLADITAEVGAEAALSEARDAATAATQLKSDFLANMSHEIRTPMNGVIGMTDLLLETALDADQRDYAQVVRNSAEALLTIINGILDFSKLEAAMLDLEENDFDLRTEVEAVVHLLAGSAQAKGLELMAAVENSVPAEVRGDPGRLRQVLMNLVGNAIKFTQSGEVVIRVSKDDGAEIGTLLHFEITDTGDGIEPDKLALIFQPFVQADTSTSRRYGGTGLGLAISGQLVTLMGGDYGVTSEPGQGSTFWFTIRVAPDIGRGAEGLTLSGEQPNLVGLTALVVDDSPSQRGLLAEQLTAWGMKVTAEDSCPSALLALRDSTTHGVPFSVALLDRSMPGMSGLELRDAIVKDPLLAATPLVLMNGLRQERDLGTGETSGFAALLTKPVRRVSLLNCLRIAMGLVDPGVSSTESDMLPPQSAGPTTGRLLLAEDNLVNQKVAVAMLTSVGYQVDTVLDGAAAVHAAANRRYDAILMDCQMPGLNGYEATAAIRDREGSDRHTPIIAMTAGARAQDRERCLSAGMDGYLAKPVSKAALVSMVASSVENSSPRADEPNMATGPVSEPALGSVPSDEIRTLTLSSAGSSGPEGPSPHRSTGATHFGPAGGRSVLDAEVLGQLEQLGETAGKDFVSQLALLFLADADIHVQAMRQGFAAANVDIVARSAHALSGASANMGATELARLCATAATDSGAKELLGDEALLEAVESELGYVRSAFADRIPAQ